MPKVIVKRKPDTERQHDEWETEFEVRDVTKLTGQQKAAMRRLVARLKQYYPKAEVKDDEGILGVVP